MSAVVKRAPNHSELEKLRARIVIFVPAIERDISLSPGAAAAEKPGMLGASTLYVLRPGPEAWESETKPGAARFRSAATSSVTW
jgi:hypothetical protein